MDLDKIAFIMSLINKGNGGSNVNLSDYYTKLQTDARIAERIAEIVVNAPEDFDTLKEISDWIANHEDSAAAMNSAIADNTASIVQKADKSTTYTKTETDNLLNNKVDKVVGKQLSTNDFTNADKSKLDSLENYDDADVKTEIAKTTEQSALNRSTLGYQRKNLLMNNCTTATRAGVTATVNEDSSITLTGSNTSGAASMIFANLQTGAASGQYTNNKKFLPNGTYILSGSKSGADIQVRLSENNVSEGRGMVSRNGVETKFTVTSSDNYVWSRVVIAANADFGSEGVTIYPMIRPAEVEDNTYEPYKPSVEERLAALEKLAALEGSVTQ